MFNIQVLNPFTSKVQIPQNSYSTYKEKGLTIC